MAFPLSLMLFMDPMTHSQNQNPDSLILGCSQVPEEHSLFPACPGLGTLPASCPMWRPPGSRHLLHLSCCVEHAVGKKRLWTPTEPSSATVT